MATALSTTRSDALATDLLVVPVASQARTDPVIAALDRRLGGRLSAQIRRVGFRARGEEELVYQTHGAAPAATILLVGIGAAPSAAAPAPTRSGVGAWYSVADAVVRHAARERARRAAVALGSHATPAVVHAVSEGIELARYRFDRYRTVSAATLPSALTLLVPANSAVLRRAVELGGVYARATALARDLANTPAADLAPRDLARSARRLSRSGLRVRVYERGALARMRMHAILGV